MKVQPSASYSLALRLEPQDAPGVFARLAAAKAIAGVLPRQELSENYVIPSIFNPRVAAEVAAAVGRAAVETGVARRKRVPQAIPSSSMEVTGAS